MSNKTAQHILSTAANLLGFCLFVITSVHVSDFSETSIIDELTSVVALFLIISCLFSFFSIKTSSEKRGVQAENIADVLFAAALIGILLIIVLIAFNFIQ